MATEAAIPEPVPVTARENYEIHGANMETGEQKPERNFDGPEISSSATGDENIEDTPKEDEADVAEVKILETDFTKQDFDAMSHTEETDTRDLENDNPNMDNKIQGNRGPLEGSLTKETSETVALSSSAPQVPQNETNDEHSGKAKGEETSIKGIEGADKMQPQSYDTSSEETCQVNAKPCESDSAGANIIAILAESSEIVENKSSQISETTEANEAGDKIMSGTLDGTSNILPEEKDEREISKGETIFKEMYVPAAREVIEAADKPSDDVEVFIVKQVSPIAAETEDELKQKEDETTDAGVEISSKDKQKDNADDEKPDGEEHLFVATEPSSETNANASNSEPYELETTEGESQILEAEKEPKTEAGREKFEDENPAHNASMPTEADTVTDAKSALLAQNSKSKGSLEEDVDIDKAVFDADAAGDNQNLEEPETESDITTTGEKIESAVAYEQPGSDPSSMPEEEKNEIFSETNKGITEEGSDNIMNKNFTNNEEKMMLFHDRSTEHLIIGQDSHEGKTMIKEEKESTFEVKEKDIMAEPQSVLAPDHKPKVVGSDLVAGENLEATGISEHIETEKVHVEEVPHQVQEISSIDGAPKEAVVVQMPDRNQDGIEELDISNAASDFKEQDIDIYESRNGSKLGETDIEYHEKERDENLEIIPENRHQAVEEVSGEAPLSEDIAQILQEPSSTKINKEQDPVITFENIEDEIRRKDGNPVTNNLDGTNATRTIEETCSLEGELRDTEIFASELETLINEKDGLDEASAALPETTAQDPQESPEEKLEEEKEIMDKDILSEHNVEKKKEINEVDNGTPADFLDAAHAKEISAEIEQPEGSKNINEQTDREKNCMAEPKMILATDQKPEVVGPDLVAGENLEATCISEHIETEQAHDEEVPQQVQEISSTDGAPMETVVVEMPDMNQDGTEELDISNAALDFKEQNIDINESRKCSEQNETDIEYREGERDENLEIISENKHQVVEEVSEEAPLAENIAQILQEPSSTKHSKEQDPVITFENEVRENDGNPVTNNLDATNATRTIEETCSQEGELRDPEISASEHETLVNEQDGLDEARQEASTALPETRAQDPQESLEEKLHEENEIMDKDISSEHNIEKKTDINEVDKETPLNFLDAAHIEEISVGIEQHEESKNIDEQTDREKDCMAEQQMVLATDQKPKVVGPDLVAGENLEATTISEHIETEQVHVEEVSHQVQEDSSIDGSPKEAVVVEMPDRNQYGIEELDISNAASNFKEQDIDIYESEKVSKQNETDIEYPEGERDENLEIISENRQIVEQVSEEAPAAENIAQILHEPSSTKYSKEQDPVITFKNIEDEIKEKDGNTMTDNLDGTNATRAIEETCSLEEELRDPEISATEHETLVNEQDGLDEARQKASTALPETTAQDFQESREEKLDEENEIMDKDISSEHNVEMKTDVNEIDNETPSDFLDAAHVEEISTEIEQLEGSKNIDEQTDGEKDCMAEPQLVLATDQKPKVVGPDLVAGENLEATGISEHIETEQVHVEEVPHQVQEISSTDGAPKETVVVEMPDRNQDGIEELDISNAASDFKKQDIDIYESEKGSKKNETDIEYPEGERDENLEIISENKHQIVEEVSEEDLAAENIAQILQEQSSTKYRKEQDPVITFENIEDEIREKDGNTMTDNLDGTNATRDIEETCSLEGELRDPEISASEHETLVKEQDSLDEARQEASTALPETTAQDPQEGPEEKLDEENEIVDKDVSSEQNIEKKTDINEVDKETPLNFLDAAHVEEMSAGIEQHEGSKNIDEQTDRTKDCMAEPQMVLATDQIPKIIGPDLVAGENLEATSISEHIEIEQVHVEEVSHQVQEISSIDGAPKEAVLVEMPDRNQDEIEEHDISNAASDFKEQDIDIYESEKVSKQNETDIEYPEGERDENLEIISENRHQIVEQVSEEAPVAEHIEQILQEPSSTKYSKEQDPVITFENIEDEIREKDGNTMTDNLDGTNATRAIEETCSLEGELRNPEISATEHETLVNEQDGLDEARQEASTGLPETTAQDFQESREEKLHEENEIVDKDISSEHNVEKKTDINEVDNETPADFLDAAHVKEISAEIKQPEGSKNIDEQTDREKDCMAEPQLVLATDQKPNVVGPDLVAGENLEAIGISEHIETEQVHVEEVPHQVQEISSTDGALKETVVVEMPDRNQDGTEELDISSAASDFKEQDIDIYESEKGPKQNETDREYPEGERDENLEIISENRHQIVDEVSKEAPAAENIAQILQEPSSTKYSKEQDPIITFENIEDEIREKDGNTMTDNLDGTNATRAMEETCSLEGELRDPDISASEHETLVNEQDSLDEAQEEASTALPETTAQDPQESPEEKLDEENEIVDKDVSSEQNIEKKTDIKEVVKEIPEDVLDAVHVEEMSAGIEQPEGSKNIDEQTDGEKDCMAEPQLVLATDQKPKVVGPDLVAGENLEATGISEHIETEQVHVEEVPHQVQEISSTDGAPKETVVVEMPDRNQDGIEELDISNAASDFKKQDIDIYESEKGSKQNETDIEYPEGERDENLEIISENKHQIVEEVSEEAPLAENIAQILQEPSSTTHSNKQDPVITLEKIEDEIKEKDGNPVTGNLDGTNATTAIDETCSLEGELRDPEISASENETLGNEQDGLDKAWQEASTALPETTAQDPQESLEKKLDEENEIMDKDISSEQNIEKKTDIKEVVKETPVDLLHAAHVEEISPGIGQTEESKRINEQTDRENDCMAEPLSTSATEEKPKELGSELVAEENLETTSISKYTDIVQVQAEEVPHQVQEISSNARTLHNETIEGTMPSINITSSTFESTEGSIEEEEVIYRAKIGTAQETMMTVDTSPKEVEEDIYIAKIETAVATMMNVETASKEVQLDECASDFTKVPEDILITEATDTTLQHEAVNIFKLGDSSSIIQPMAAEDAGADKDNVMVEMPNRNRESIEELDTSNEVSDFNEQDNNICEKGRNSTLNETDIENKVEERTEASEIISESKNQVVEELTKEAPLAENLTQILQEPSSAIRCEEQEQITTATTEKIDDESEKKDESPVEDTNDTRTTEETRSLEGEAKVLGFSPSEHEIFENKQDTLDEGPHEEASTNLPETSTPEHLKEKLDEENETMDNGTSSEQLQNEDQKSDIMEVAKETPIEFLDAAQVEEDVGRTSESEKIKGEGVATDGTNQDITADGRTNVSCWEEEVHSTGGKTNTEATALTEENFHPHEEGELRSASDLISENEISGTFPKPDKTETMENTNNLKDHIQECTVEQISGKDSKHGQMNLNEVATGDQVNSTQDQLETIRDVILAEEIEHVPEESQTEKGSEDIKDHIIEATTEFQKTKPSYITPSEVTDTDPTHIENLGVKYQNVDSETEDPHAAEDPNEESSVSLIIRSTERELKEGTENLLNISSPEQQVSHNIREENIESTYIYHSQESVRLSAEESVEKVQVDEKPSDQHEEEVERVNLKETDSIVLPVVTTVVAVAEEERMKAKKLDTEEAQTGEIESSVPATKDIEQVSKSVAATRTGKEEVSEVPKPIPEPLNTVEPVIEGNKFPHESLPYETIKDQHEESSATKLLEEQKCENITINETIEDQSTKNYKTLVKESSESPIARCTAEDVSLKNETFKEVESSKLELEINDHPDGATTEEKIPALEEITAIVKENNEYIETHEELMPVYESVADDQTKETEDSEEVKKDILMAEEVGQGITPTAQSVVVVPDAEEKANVKLYDNEEGTHMKELTSVPVENVGEIIKSDLGPIENLEVRESIETTEAEKLQAKEDLISDSGVPEEDKRQHIENTIITGADEPIKTVKEQSIDANKESETFQASDAYKTRDGKLEARDSIEDTGAEKLQDKEDLNWDSRASTVTGESEEDAKQRVASTIMTTKLEEPEQIIRDESAENCGANKECEVLREPDETSKAFGAESKPIEQDTPINAIITKELPEETEWADLTKNILEAMMAGDAPLKEFSTNEILLQPTEETKNILEETTNTDTEQQSYGSRGTSGEYIAPTEELSGREEPAKDIQVETMAKGTPLEESVTYSIGDGMVTKILQEETKVGNNIEEVAIRLDPEGKSDEINCANTNSEDINLIKEVSEEVERASQTEDIRGNTMIEATGELSQLPVPDGIANEILPQEPNEIKNVEATIKLDLKENSEEGIFSGVSKEATTCSEELSKEVEVREETMVEHTPIQELSHHQIANKTVNEISSHETEEIKNDEEAPTILDLKETSDETNCTNMNEATTLVEKLPHDIEKTAPAEDIREETMDNLVEELPQQAIVGGIASDVLPQQTEDINNVEEVPIKDRDTTTQAITLVEEHLEEAGKDGPIEDIREETATNTPLEKPSQYSIGDEIATQILPQEKEEVKNVSEEPSKLNVEEKRDKAKCGDESTEASTLIEELSKDVERAGMAEDIQEEAKFEGIHAEEQCQNPQYTEEGENVGKGIQKLKDSLSVVDKQNQHETGSNEYVEAKLSASSIHVAPEQTEPVGKSFNIEDEDSTAADAIGSEPQCQAEDFKEEKETSKRNEDKQDSPKSSLAFLIRESTTGISEELEKLLQEKEQKEKQEDLDKARLRTNEKEQNSEEKEEEQNQEGGDDNQKEDSGYDAPVMVEASKDVDIKVHKKPHNILSGVGTKVKHSISKVKKAITGKSSHPKPSSP